MYNACPMLGTLLGYQEKFKTCLQDTNTDFDNDEKTQDFMDYSVQSIQVPFTNGITPDDGNDLIPDAEHEYRLRLRMLQYRLRDQPSKCPFDHLQIQQFFEFF